MEKILKTKNLIILVLILIVGTTFTFGFVQDNSFAAVRKPAKVSKLYAESYSTSQIKLSWSKAKRAKTYRVYMYSDGKYKSVKKTSQRSYIVSKLKSGKKYSFKVRAYNGKKAGKFSPVKSAYTKQTASTSLSKGDLPANNLTLSEIRSEMLLQINARRNSSGKKSLEPRSEIDSLAQIKAQDMYDTGVFSHYSKNLGYFYDQLTGAGISYWAAGENIAYGQTTVNSVMNSWWNSSGHKDNILNTNYTHVGIGYYKGYWVQLFVQPR
ncbi:MAG: CAP domain-containing protein [Lentihominibacter sp.]|jgi:uncharacterized protein YkwD